MSERYSKRRQRLTTSFWRFCSEEAMRTDSRYVVGRLVVTFGMLVAGCGGSSTAPTSSAAAALPVPVSPINVAVIPQSNPASGCAGDAATGLGTYIQFNWAAASTPTGIAGYELYVIHVGALNPIVDTETATTGYTYTACGGFVTDANLNNWQWRVRAYDARAQFTDWSAWASFQFAPCRLSDGTPCHVPN